MGTGFHGIYPMQYAFFGRDGGLDRGAIEAQVAACLEAGVHGIAVGGLASECNKLTTAEKRQFVDWVAAALGGRRPLSVTLSDNTVDGQIESGRAAVAAGADWLVLQPPPVRGIEEAALVDFFAAVAAGLDRPVAVQNAAAFLGVGLSNQALVELNRRQPNVALLKAEGPPLEIRALIEAAGGAFEVFNGRNGLELIDSLRAGCAGLIPGVEACDMQARIYDLMRAGQEDEAERLFREILPVLAAVMQSIEHLICYGKPLAARRIGLGAVHARMPTQSPTRFGSELVARWARHLPDF